MSPKALVIGEALVDIVVTGDGEREIPGGSPANVALTLGRLGRAAELVTWLANDERGRKVADHIRASQVTITEGSFGADRTSTARATIDESGAATYEFDLTWKVPPIDIDSSTIVAHSGSIAATLEPGGTAVVDALTRARPHATITYDPNARPSIMGDPEKALRRVEEIVSLSDVVKVSDEDIFWLTVGKSVEDTAARWLERGASLVVVTRGADGATAFFAGGSENIGVPPVDVVDTVGAGDSFMGGLIDALWSEDLLGAARRKQLATIDRDTVTRILERASAVSTITVSRAGANPPWADELD
ncbi:MAG: carbohydrate kinase [Actinomycetaceae bacterium]|nr:carbohydrate kinase [Actinomycetaceae bacterium]